jgi:hypothetical protein
MSTRILPVWGIFDQLKAGIFSSLHGRARNEQNKRNLFRRYQLVLYTLPFHSMHMYAYIMHKHGILCIPFPINCIDGVLIRYTWVKSTQNIFVTFILLQNQSSFKHKTRHRWIDKKIRVTVILK